MKVGEVHFDARSGKFIKLVFPPDPNASCHGCVYSAYSGIAGMANTSGRECDPMLCVTGDCVNVQYNIATKEEAEIYVKALSMSVLGDAANTQPIRAKSIRRLNLKQET